MKRNLQRAALFILGILLATFFSNYFTFSIVSVAKADGIWAGPSNIFAGTFPCVAVRPSDGDMFVIGTDYSNNIFYGDSAHNYAVTTIDSVSGSAPARPRGIFDASGNLQLVWQQRNLSSGQYDTFYTTINTSNQVGTVRDLTLEMGYTTGKTPDIAVSPVDGHIYVAQEIDAARVNVIESDDGGAHFGNPATLGYGQPGNTGTRIAVDKNNILHFVFENGNDVYASERINGTWTSGIVVDSKGTPGNRSFWPSIAVGPNGDAYVAWQEDSVAVSGSSEISFARWDHNSQSWQPEIQNISQTHSGVAARVPSVAVGPENNVWVTWEVDTNGQGPAGGQYTYSTNNGQSFSNVDAISPQTYGRNGPWNDAAISNGQIYWVGQLGDSSGNYSLWLANTKTDGSGTPNPTGKQWAGPNPLFNGTFPTVAVRSSDNDVFVIATDYANEIFYGDSKHNYVLNVISNSAGSSPARPRAAFDANGNLQVVWQQRNATTGQYDTFYTVISFSGSIGAIRDLTHELGYVTGKTPDIAVSPVDGHLYLAQEVDNAQVSVAESNDGGAHFGNAKILGSGAPGNTGTRIAVDKNNIVHFVYENSSDVIALERINGTWSNPTKVDNKGAPNNRSFWPYVTIGPNGDAYVAWQEDSVAISGSSEISLARWDHSSQIWQPEVQNISQTSNNIAARVPTIAVGAEGNVWLIWQTDTGGVAPANVEYAVSTDNAATFSAPATLSLASFNRSGPWADVYAGSDGQIYWAGQLADNSGTYQIWTASTKSDGSGPGIAAGTIWSTPKTVFGIPTVFPAIKVRPSDGDVFVIATDYVNTIYYGDSAHGFQPVTIYSSSNSAPARPRAAFDSSGNLQIVWQQRNPTSQQYDTFYTTVYANNSVGRVRDLTTTLGFGTGKLPDIAISPVDGHFYLAQETDNGIVRVSESDNGGANWGNTVILGSGNLGNTGPRLAVDSNNIIHFVYENSVNVIARERINGTWTNAVQVDNLGTTRNRSFWPYIAVGPNGDAYVAWQEDSASVSGSSQISFARWDHNSRSWQPEIQNASRTSTSVAARTPAIAVGSEGNVWVTWEIDTNGGSPAGAQFAISSDGGHSLSSVQEIATPLFTRSGPWSDVTSGNNQIYFAGQLGNSAGTYQIWLSSVSSSGVIPNTIPPTATPLLSTNNAAGFTVRLNLANNVHDPGTSGVATVQISNDASFSHFLELPYNSSLTNVLWNLGAPQYGGNYNSGTKTVYVRYKNGAGYYNVTPYSLSQSVSETTASFTNKTYSPEGDTSNGNSEYLSFYNPNSNQDGTIYVSYSDANGQSYVAGYPIAAGGRATVAVQETIQGLNATSISSDEPLVGEALSLGHSTPNVLLDGMDALLLTATPATNFYFADGSTTNGSTTSFELFNQGTTAATVTLTYSQWNGGIIGTPVTTTIAPNARATITNVPTNANFATQISVSNNQPIFASRRIGLSDGSYATMNGLTTPQPKWLFANGTTGASNSDSIGVFNTNSFPITLTYQFYKADGSQTITASQSLAANAANVSTIDQFLHSFGIAGGATAQKWQTVVTAIDANGKPQPFLAEQAQLRRGEAFATEQGAINTATQWVTLANAFPNNVSDNLIIANFSDQATTAQIAAYGESGTQLCTNCQAAVTIPAHGRLEIPVSSLQGVYGNRTAIVVTSASGVVVEHNQRVDGDEAITLAQPLAGVSPATTVSVQSTK